MVHESQIEADVEREYGNAVLMISGGAAALVFGVLIVALAIGDEPAFSDGGGPGWWCLLAAAGSFAAVRSLLILLLGGAFRR